MKKITLLIVALFLFFYGTAQTVLTAGDIAFVGSNTDGATNNEDTFAFVLLKDIDALTTIIFTDRGWNDSGGFFTTSGDGEFTWTSGIPRTAGEVVTLNMTPLFPAAYSSIGDQLFAIQGSIASPIFIAGLQFNDAPGDDANWDGAATSNSTSALPNALINGVNAIRLIDVINGEQDNWQFSCLLVPGGSPITGTPAAIRAIINNRTYWNGNNSTIYNPTLEAGCSFTIAVAGDSTPPVITCGPTPTAILAGINGMAPIPDLTTGTSATDDVSIPTNITITQSPSAGTMANVGIHSVVLTATDEAGNTATCSINVTINEPPTTTLSAGDIAFVGFNLDGNDSFAFVLLKDIIAGTNIKLTDCGVSNPNTITCAGSGGEGSATWYAPSSMSAGDIVTLQGSFITGSVLASIGDQIFAYQGTTASPVFIAAIHSNVEAGTNDSDWDGINDSNANSALPNQLINGTNAIRLYSVGPPEVEMDNWQFNCSLVLGGSPITGTPANVAAIINNKDYWTSSDTSEYIPTANAGCNFSVVVSSDATPPVITNCGSTPSDITADVLGNATVPDFTGDVIATDDITLVGNLTIVQSPVAGSTITAGITPVTLFVSDEAGNIATCSINVTVVNIVATTLLAGDIAFVGINTDGTDSFAFVLLQNILAGTMINFTDCGVNNPNTIACNGVNDETHTWFAPTDMLAGDIITLDATFIGSLGAIGDQLFAYQGDATTPTFIAGIHNSVVPSTSDADWDGSNISGDTSALPDQLTNGVNAIRLYATGPPETEVDNWQFDCSLLPLGTTLDGTPLQLASLINNRNYWINNDSNEYNPASKTGCIYNVFLDLIPPVAICKSITVQLNASGTVSIIAADVNNISTDNIGIVSYSIDKTTFTCSDIGPNNVTLTVTDATGNSDTCIAVITVEDSIAPTLTAVSNQNEDLDVDCNFTIPDYTSLTTAADNCGTTTVTQSPLAGVVINGHGTVQTITLTANDGNGNSDSTTFDVTLLDGILPTLTSVIDRNEDLDTDCNFTIPDYTSLTTAADNCGTATVTQSPLAGVVINGHGTVQTITLTANDGNGNSDSTSFDITLIDGILPTLTAVTNRTEILDANCDFTIPDYTGLTTAADNCGMTSISQSPIATTIISGHGTVQTITLTADDGHGNTNTTTFDITIVDVTLPSLTIVSNRNEDLDASCNFTIPNYTSLTTAADSCGMVSVSQSPMVGTVISGHGTIQTITLTANDGNGNTNSTTFDITLVDTTIPSLTSVIDRNEDLDASCNFTIPDYTSLTTATDNCGTATVTQSPLAGFVINGHGTVQTITLTANDGNGNSDSTSFDITLIDGILPTLTTVSNRTENLDAMCSFTIPDYTSLTTAADNCGMVSVSQSPILGTVISGHGTVQTITLTVNDGNGNSDSTSFDVTLADATPPTITCPADIIVSNDAGVCGATIYLISDLILQYDPTGYHEGSPLTPSYIQSGFVASDLSGPLLTCCNTDVLPVGQITSSPIAQLDSYLEFDVTPSTSSLSLDRMQYSRRSYYGTASSLASIRSSLDGFTSDISLISVNSSIVYPQTEELIFNLTSLPAITENITFRIYFFGATSNFSDWDDLASTNAGGNGIRLYATSIETIANATDNCGIATLENDWTETSTLDGANFPVGETTVTWTATDTAGNIATCSSTITVTDTEAPIVNSQNITAQLDINGEVTITPEMVDNGSTDNCEIDRMQIANNNGLTSSTIYFTGTRNGKVWSANRDGTGSPIVLYDTSDGINTQGPVGIEVNLNNGNLYFGGGNTSNIFVASLDGNGTIDAVPNTNSGYERHDFEFDWTNNRVFYTGDEQGGFVANADGTGTATNLTNTSIIALTYNRSNGKIYYVNHSSWNIGVINADGTNENVNLLETDSPRGITVNEVAGRLFWTEKNLGKIYTALADGSETPYELYDDGANGIPYGIDYDATTGMLYWTVFNNGALMDYVLMAPADGSGMPELVYSGDFGGIRGIAVGRNIEGASIPSESVSYTCENVGDNTVSLTVTDIHGNSNTATAIVTVEDTIKPIVNTQDITVQLNADGLATITPAQIDNVSTDNCEIDTYVLDITEFSCSNVGENEVILTVTDVNGNSNTATAIVTVEDTVKPTVNTQNITVQLNENGVASITTSQIDNLSTDNCSIESYSLDISDFDCEDVNSPLTVTLTVIDVNGNSDSATAIVTVEDNVAPIVNTQDITVQLDANGLATITPAQIDNESTDNCTIESYGLDITAFDCSNAGENTVTLTVTDIYGNSDSSTALVTV
uniref:beta strand repeat-containing protein n=1 Tax=Lutibacter sp. TaxID=1925666 RepID=UPI0035664C44